MKCPECKKEMFEAQEVYHYTESGLDNVFISNLCVRRCTCGEEIASIPNVIELNTLIGKSLLKKPGRLNGKEIVFLRKNIGMSATDFAKALGVDKSTLSRWENGAANFTRSHDRSIRFLYALNKDLPQEEREEFLKRVSQDFKDTPALDKINILADELTGGKNLCFSAFS